MMNELSVIEVGNEPRVLDTDLAVRLGLSRVTNIRAMIAANRDELETFGGLHVASANPTAQGGRPGKAYFLNEGQALVICALSRTEKAAQVRKMLIDLFMAYRQGKIVHVKEHRRLLPRVGKADIDFPTYLERAREFVRASTADPEEMLASVLARLLLIERELGGR